MVVSDELQSFFLHLNREHPMLKGDRLFGPRAAASAVRSSRQAWRGAFTSFISLLEQVRRDVLSLLPLLAASMRPNPGFLSSFSAVDGTREKQPVRLSYIGMAGLKP